MEEVSIMMDNRKNNLWNNEKFRSNKPASQKDKPLQEGDSLLEEQIEEEIKDIEALEKEVEQNIADHPTIIELRVEVQSLKDELKDSHDKLLRAHAEMENVRQRSVQDIEKAHRYGLEKFINGLLPVADGLEASLKNCAVENNPVIDGVKLTLKMFLDALDRFGVKQINPQDQKFNPQLHEAMSMQKREDVEPNVVIDVMQKGYEINGRLIRPALVVVSSE